MGIISVMNEQSFITGLQIYWEFVCLAILLLLFSVHLACHCTHQPAALPGTWGWTNCKLKILLKMRPLFLFHVQLTWSGLVPDILKMESWTLMGHTANIIIKDIIHIFASIAKNMHILLMGRRYRERWWFLKSNLWRSAGLREIRCLLE